MVSKVSGKFDDLTGMINADTKTQSALVRPVHHQGRVDRHRQSPIATRTSQEPDFFDVEKLPEITFKSTSIKPSGKKDAYDVTGDLTMHGVTKHITIPVEFLGSAKDPWGNERAGFTLTHDAQPQGLRYQLEQGARQWRRPAR